MSRRSSDVVVLSDSGADAPEAPESEQARALIPTGARDLILRGLRWPPLLPTVLAIALAVWYLTADYVGSDLAAQLARADFARADPLTPIDLRWFSGTSVFGYSLWTPALMAWVGVRLTGAVCCVLATAQLTVLFVRTGARRPIFAGALAAVLQAVNLVAGRVTFAVGTVCALAALLTLAPRRRDAPMRHAGWVTALWALAAGAASPVAALFLWVCGGALVVHRRARDGLILVAASALTVLVSAAVFGSGGPEPFAFRDARDAFLATLAVVVLAPRRPPVLRTAALIGAVMVVTAYLFSTAVGNNATRLSLIFAIPVVAAYTGRRLWVTLLAVAVTAYPQQLGQRYSFIHSPGAQAAFYTPLLDQLDQRGPIDGRVEVPETKGHWDAAYLARHVYLARGWLRQTDIARNSALFFSDQPITDAAYHRFLTANAVQYIAVPVVPLTVAGQKEADFLHAGHHSYLRQVWRSPDWTLYDVTEASPIVGRPGRLVSADPASLTLEMPTAGVVPINLVWSRWLEVRGPSGACLTPGDGDTVRLQVMRPGTYTITSGLFPPDTDCR